MRKIIALLCAFAMLLPLSACNTPGTSEVSETTGAGETTVAPETEAPETERIVAFDTVPKKELGGVFRILYGESDRCYEDFRAESQIGDVKNDSIYRRNTMVEENFGIDIELSWDGHAQVNDACRVQVNSGDSSYDLFGGHRDSLSLTTMGLQYDLRSIKSLDLTQEWWDQNWVNSITINDSLYTVIGDIGISTLLFVSALTFNKDLMDDYKIEYPYELVKQGKWTLEELYNLTAESGADLNGDGAVTLEDDRFSIVGWGTEAGYSQFYGSGFSFVTQNNKGESVLSYNRERVVDILNRVADVWSTPYAKFFEGTNRNQMNALYGTFAEGRALFSDIVLSKIGTQYADMEQDYGIVPIPKYDAAQENYSAYLGYTIPVMFMPSNATDPERTGTIMEALCTASYDEVTPKMLEIVTKIKNARDEESSEMIEIIIRNKHIDAAHFYKLNGLHDFPRNALGGRIASPISHLESNELVAITRWKEIVALIDGLK